MKFRDPSNPMWIQALKMLEQADQLHKHFFQLVKPKPSGPVWEPPADILETDRQFLILIALPGVDRLEIPYGRFEKRISLPAGNYKMTENVLMNGCLRLVLNKLG